MWKQHTLWWQVRWAFYSIAFINGLLRSISDKGDGGIQFSELLDVGLIIFTIFFLAMIPLAVAAVISLQAINPHSAPFWQRPTNETNPFSLRDPLQLVHFFGYLCILNSLGGVAGSPFSHFNMTIDNMIGIVAGFCILVGVRLVMRWFKKKIKVSDENE